MIEALRGLDEDRAADVLATAAFATSANAGFVALHVDQTVQNVLKEIRSTLKIADDDDSIASHARMDEFLSRAYDSSAMSVARLDAARARVGTLGLLGPNSYHVVQPAEFERRFRPLEAPKKLVRETVLNPDDYQHLMNEDLASADDYERFSLFLKRVGSGRSQHWFLVQTFRNGIEQEAQSAWHVHPSDVDLSDAKKPLDVLRAFVEKFGIEIIVGSKRAKFVHEEVFSKSPLSDEMAVHSMLPARPNIFNTISICKLADRSKFMVGLAYCIDLAAYAESLRSKP